MSGKISLDDEEDDEELDAGDGAGAADGAAGFDHLRRNETKVNGEIERKKKEGRRRK